MSRIRFVIESQSETASNGDCPERPFSSYLLTLSLVGIVPEPVYLSFSIACNAFSMARLRVGAMKVRRSPVLSVYCAKNANQ